MPNAVPSQASDGDFASFISALQKNNLLAQFDGSNIFLIFTTGITFKNEDSTANYGVAPNGWCAYHGDWSSIFGDGYYALIPKPVPGIACCSNDQAAWQSITSHEIQEWLTDPDGATGWRVGLGGDEGGDECSFIEFTLSFGTVQAFADNKNQACSIFS